MTSSIYILLALQLVVSQSFYYSLAGSTQGFKVESNDDEDRSKNVAAIKSVLLNVLGLKSEPVPGTLRHRREQVPDIMWQLYRRQLAENIRRQHRSTDGDAESDHSRRETRTKKPASTSFSGNTIRSFVAVSQTTTVGDQMPYDDDVNSLAVLQPVDQPAVDNSGNAVRVSFNVSHSLNDDILYGAELRLCRHSTRSRQRRDADGVRNFPKKYRISVYQVMQSSEKDPIRRLLDTKIVNSELVSSTMTSDDNFDTDHWVSLDVSPAVATWKQHGMRSNLGLDVQTSTLDGKPIDIEQHVRVRRSTNRVSGGRGERVRSTASQSDDSRRQPLLVTYADDQRSMQSASKRKRSAAGARNRDRKTSSNRPPSCRRRPLYVDFTEVEWNDWIVAPVGYQAFMCNGVCPHVLPDHLNATNHAQIQSLLHSYSRSVPPPCCVPTELSPVSLLYFDETGTVVLRNYEDMVVDACGCR